MKPPNGVSTVGQNAFDSAQGNTPDSSSNTGALQNLQALGLLPRAPMPQQSPDAGQSDSDGGTPNVMANLPSEALGNSNGPTGAGISSSSAQAQPGSSGLSPSQTTTTTNSQNSTLGSSTNPAASSLPTGGVPSRQTGTPDPDSSAQPSGLMDPLGILGTSQLDGLNSMLNTPIPISDPTIRGALDTAAGAMVPSTWEVIRPAGVGGPDAERGLSMNDADSVSNESDADTKQLDGGVMRMALRTGPMNPLVLPPDFDSVVYVIDTSGSMVGGKFQQVSQALVDAVSQMQPNQKFAVILFNTLAIRAKGTGYRNADASVAQALASELRSITPVGGTDPTNALLIALQMKPQTIVVLSDGEFEQMVVDQVTRLNRVSGLNSQINCIAIGTNVLTLQQLATRNGPGNYVEAK